MLFLGSSLGLLQVILLFGLLDFIRVVTLHTFRPGSYPSSIEQKKKILKDAGEGSNLGVGFKYDFLLKRRDWISEQ